MSGIFPYINRKPSWHLLLKLLRWVLLHSGEPNTSQACVHPSQAASSSLCSVESDLGNVIGSELLWLSSLTWAWSCWLSRPQWETQIRCYKVIHSLSFSTAICFFTGKACSSWTICHHCWLGFTWPYPIYITAFLFQMCALELRGFAPQELLYDFLTGSNPSESSLLRSKEGPLKLLPKSMPSLSFIQRVTKQMLSISYFILSSQLVIFDITGKIQVSYLC